MSVEKVFLVIGADRRYRVAKRPQVRQDEVAIAINVRFPDTWGRVVSTIDIDVPDFAPTEAEAEDGGYGP